MAQRLVAILAIAAGAATASACLEVSPTQAIVFVDTDLPGTPGFSVRIRARQDSAFEMFGPFGFAQRPASFGVVIDGEDVDRQVELELDGLVDGAPVVTVKRVLGGFIAHQTIQFEVFLAAQCSTLAAVPLACGAGESCERCGCASANGECRAIDGGVEDTGVEDTGVEDTGVEDAGVEDSGLEDTGVEDAGVEDANLRDGAVPPDAMTTGPLDAGPLDAAVSAGCIGMADGTPCGPFVDCFDIVKEFTAHPPACTSGSGPIRGTCSSEICAAASNADCVNTPAGVTLTCDDACALASPACTPGTMFNPSVGAICATSGTTAACSGYICLDSGSSSGARSSECSAAGVCALTSYEDCSPFVCTLSGGCLDECTLDTDCYNPTATCSMGECI